VKLKDVFSPSLEAELNQAFKDLSKRNGEEVSKRCGVIFLPPRKPKRKFGRYIVNLLTKTYSVELESREVVDLISGKQAPAELALVITRYLAYSSGGRHRESWIPYERFPGSKPLIPLFNRNVLRPFARLFGYEPEKYLDVCKRLGGKRERLGGFSFSFLFLPKVKLLTQIWKARREHYIPPAANISFNYSARYYLSARDLLLVGQLMVKILEYEAKKA